MNISEELLSWLTGLILGLLVLATAGSGIYLYIFQDRIYPEVTIDQIDVGGLTPAEALFLLEKKASPLPQYEVVLQVDQVKIATSANSLGLTKNYQQAVERAYQLGRNETSFNRIKKLLVHLLVPTKLEVELVYQADLVEKFVNNFKEKIDLKGAFPSATLRYTGSPASLVVDPGIPGRNLDATQAAQLIYQLAGQPQIITPPIASTSTPLSEEEVEKAQDKALKLVGQRLIFNADAARLELSDQDLIKLLAFPNGYQQDALSTQLTNWQTEFNRPAQNAEFDYDPQSLQVNKFVPPLSGLALDTTALSQMIQVEIEKIIAQKAEGIQTGLNQGQDIMASLPVMATEPEVTLEDTNDLGINQKIGFGESEYDHSIPNRIHNVSLTTDRISPVIVPPGVEFSFNKTLGDVSSQTGFRSAYVIKNGKTELGDGGGVCQVSTTLFRAILDAGLNITRRLPHSYRVSYYELNAKPGIDATVYAGNVDLRFINDTPAHILIFGQADPENLYMTMEIYGTSDGRTTEITNHQVWDYRPAPPAEYITDPSLPAGTRKQVDWAVGGVKAKFDHTIRDQSGQVISQNTYYSNYIPWSAKYLVGE